MTSGRVIAPPILGVLWLVGLYLFEGSRFVKKLLNEASFI